MVKVVKDTYLAMLEVWSRRNGRWNIWTMLDTYLERYIFEICHSIIVFVLNQNLSMTRKLVNSSVIGVNFSVESGDAKFVRVIILYIFC